MDKVSDAFEAYDARFRAERTPLPEKLPFGCRVRFIAKLQRKSSAGVIHGRLSKEWRRLRVLPVLEGIYLGMRTLSNGYSSFDPEVVTWVPQEYIRVALVCYSERRQPVNVLLDDLEVVAAPAV